MISANIPFAQPGSSATTLRNVAANAVRDAVKAVRAGETGAELFFYTRAGDNIIAGLKLNPEAVKHRLGLPAGLPIEEIMILRIAQDAQLNLLKPPYLHEGLGLALVGNKGSGKSNTLAVLAEEAHASHIPFLFFDPNGDAASLRTLGDDVVIIGRLERTTPMRRAHFALQDAATKPMYYARLALEEGFSLVFDLSGEAIDEQCRIFSAFMAAYFALAGELREPSMLLVDETHLFAPQSRATTAQRESLAMFTRLMSDGRKRGILLALATQRAQYLNKDVLALANVRMFGKITWDDDFRRIKAYLPPAARHFEALNRLQAGEHYLVSQNRWGRVQVKRRQTPDLGKTPVVRPNRRQTRPSLCDLQLALPFVIRPEPEGAPLE